MGLGGVSLLFPADLHDILDSNLVMFFVVKEICRMKRKLVSLFLGVLLGGFVLAGCGNKDQGVPGGSLAGSSVSVSKSGGSSSSDSGASSTAEDESSSKLPPEGTPVPEPDESLPFYLAGTTDERDESAEPFNPEGLAVFPGEEIQLKESGKKASLGETFSVASSFGSYELTLEDAALTDDRAEGFPADRVLRVTYTYAGTDYDGELMVSSLFFRLYDSDGKACSPYVVGNKKEKNSARPLSSGESCTANIYFILPEGSSKATLVFDDLMEAEDPTEFYWELSI